VHNSNFVAGQSWYVLTHSKGVFIKGRSKINKIWGFAGQIKSFRGPHLARRPYIVHACSKYWVSNYFKKEFHRSSYKIMNYVMLQFWIFAINLISERILPKKEILKSPLKYSVLSLDMWIIILLNVFATFLLFATIHLVCSRLSYFS